MNAITRFLVAFGRFWYEFIIGDDAKIAIAVVLGLAVTGGLMATAYAYNLPLGPVAVAGVVIVLASFVVALMIDLHMRGR
jgi:drug/metabolite transporter (DMT)-like permease